MSATAVLHRAALDLGAPTHPGCDDCPVFQALLSRRVPPATVTPINVSTLTSISAKESR